MVLWKCHMTKLEHLLGLLKVLLFLVCFGKLEVGLWCDGWCLPSKAIGLVFESGKQPLQKHGGKAAY